MRNTASYKEGATNGTTCLPGRGRLQEGNLPGYKLLVWVWSVIFWKRMEKYAP